MRAAVAASTPCRATSRTATRMHQHIRRSPASYRPDRSAAVSRLPRRRNVRQNFPAVNVNAMHKATASMGAAITARSAMSLDASRQKEMREQIMPKVSRVIAQWQTNGVTVSLRKKSSSGKEPGADGSYTPFHMLASGLFLLGFSLWESKEKNDEEKEWDVVSNEITPRPDLPTLSLDEVAKHYDMDTGVWVTYRGGVYDVTSFVKAHPGRAGRLLMAGGQALEPFWDVYRQHYRGHVVAFLEQYRIGNLSPADQQKASTAFEFGDAYDDDPPRHPDCVPCTFKPFCGETRLDLMTESYLTPNELFYTRNHAAVPVIADDEYELIVSVPGQKEKTFTLQDLKTKFPKYEVVSTIQCAGNRNEDYHGIIKSPSQSMYMAPHWNVGAISNAKWGGVRMRDLLKECGMDVDALALGTHPSHNYNHVKMESYDEDETGSQYSASTYFDKVVDPNGDCIVAYEMNGRELTRDHGYPARAIIPGHAGARQPKWLHKITVQEAPVGVLQCLSFAPDVNFEQHLSEWPPTKVPPGNVVQEGQYGNVVQEMPVQSLVCNPPQNATLGAKGLEEVELKGIAWSGGGSGIFRVDVSTNGGNEFTAAELYKPVKQHRRGQWGWTQFHKRVPLPEDVKQRLRRGEKVEIELTSKATDGHHNVQPERPGPYINARGVAVNHWYRVKVTLDPSRPASYVHNPAAELSAQGKFSNAPSGGQVLKPWNEHGWESRAKPGETTSSWYKEIGTSRGSTASEPGIEERVDWNFYRKQAENVMSSQEQAARGGVKR